jgi:hypothetical protein
MSYLINIGITLLITVAATFGIQNYVPLSWIDKFAPQQQNYGTTLVTIAGSDTISGSRTTINNNFTALNNGKIEVSTTTLPLLTTLTNLATVGTITSGVWSGTALTWAKGGNASTTLSVNQILLGNTTSGFKTVSGYGTNGQFLTSAGTGNAPTWTTSSIDQGIPYHFTANIIFDSANFTIASSTNATSTNLTVTNNSIFSGSFSFGNATGTNLNMTYASTTNLVVSNLVVSNPITGTILPAEYIASDVLVASADTERASTDASSYTVIKQITIKIPGTYRIKFDLKYCGGTPDTVYGRIYKNASAIGAEQSTNSATYVTFSEDLGSFVRGDAIQLYYHRTSGNGCVAVQNYRLYGTLFQPTVFSIDQN